MVTGFTGYPITAGPFFQKTVRRFVNATYSSVTTGKYLIIFSGLGEKKWWMHRRGAEGAEKNTNAKTKRLNHEEHPEFNKRTHLTGQAKKKQNI